MTRTPLSKHQLVVLFFSFVGGNQRELARKKAEQKKKTQPGNSAKKATAGGESLQARKSRDADIMKEKQRLAEEKKTQGQ